MRHKIVLYNPQAVFFTMPLALMTIASGLDPARFRVVIIDARLEADPERRLVEECADALLLGVTVLTGRPLKDALTMSRAVKASHPSLPVVWGGWHPSLFPAQCLADPAVDAVAIAQGEATFLDVVDRVVEARPLAGTPGLWTKDADGVAVAGPTRPLTDVGKLAVHDYGMFPVERYFALKGKRQLDYISSQGCPYRCAFCADPAVYNRSWSGLPADRMLAELLALHARYQLDEVALHHELFFVNRRRAEAFVDGLIAAGSPFTWTATLRADQASRMDPSLFERLARSRCRELLIGVETGSPALLARISKDITLDQVLLAAELCAKHGVGCRFPFIIGFPDEPPESVWDTIAVAKRLRRMNPQFNVNIFSYAPYPGSELYRALENDGETRLPQDLDDWTAFDYVSSRGPWTSVEKQELVDNVEFYLHHGYRPKKTPLHRLLGRAARWRCTNDEYRFPIEKRLVEWLRKPAAMA
jgi:anaerobic magnesium-protoporphyrin IX monomethyl ester cyclase